MALMTGMDKDKRTLFVLGLSMSVLGLVFVVTSIMSMEIRASNQSELAHAADTLSLEAAGRLQSYLSQYEQHLRAVRGDVLADGWAHITQARFEAFNASLSDSEDYSGTAVFGLLRPAAVDVSAQARDETGLYSASDHSGVKAGYPLAALYVYPGTPENLAVAENIAVMPAIHTAAERAARAGKTSLSVPFAQNRPAAAEKNFVAFMLPVYEGGSVPRTEAQRLQQVSGWSYAVVPVEDLVSALGLDMATVSVNVTDMTSMSDPIPVYDDRRILHAEEVVHTRSVDIDVEGRQWKLNLRMLPAFRDKIYQRSVGNPLLIGLIGGLGYILIAIIWRQSQHRFHLLSSTRAELERVVEGSVDGIIGKTLDGVVTSWNHGAELIFGYTAQEAIGRPLAELVVPDDLRHEEDEILGAVSAGGIIPHLETRRKCKDGRVINVSVAISPIRNAAGNVTAISKTVRDITHQKQVEGELIHLKESLEIEVVRRTEELEHARRTLRTVFDALPTAIGYWDRSGINRVANRTYHDWFGIDPDSMPGHSMEDLFGRPFCNEVAPYIEAVLKGAAQTFERIVESPGGVVRSTLNHYIPDVVDGHAEGFFVIAHDITELSESRSRLSVALRQNEALLGTINEQLFYSETDINGVIVAVNDNFCRAHGYTRDELVGRTHRIVASGVHPDRYWQQMWDTLRSGRAWHGDICNVTRTGRSLWFETVIAPVLDEDGRITRFIALRIDLTDRKNAESEIRRLNQMLRNVLSAASEVSIIAADLTGLITVFNTGAERMLGYSEAEMVGRQTPLILHQPDEMTQRAQEVFEKYGTSVAGIEVFTFVPSREGAETREWTYVRKDGGLLTVNLSVSAMRDDGGEINGYLGIAMDITDTRRQQLELAETKDQLELAAQIASMGVWSWDLGQDQLTWDSQMKEMFGVPEDFDLSQITYGFWLSRLNPDDAVITDQLLKEAIAKGSDFCPIYRIAHPDGNMRYMQAGAYIVRNRAGTAIRVIGICLDVTDRMLSLEYMTQAKVQAEQASVAKGQFLANMSHEIRTPMNAVLGMLQLLKKTELDLRQYDYVDKAQVAARSLLGLLNDILDFSKIEAGKLQLDIYSFDLDRMLRDLAVVLSGNVGERELELLFDIDPQIPPWLLGDQMRLQQVLINLAGNAIKFTTRGQVVVSIHLLALEVEKVRLRFSVTDTGIGISADQVERIFEGFSQAESSTTRRYGGTGLGLSISKRLVDMMEGNLQVSSEPGKGSCFHFDIALGYAPPEEHLQLSDLPESCRVLVVDDNRSSLELIAALVQARGWRADITVRGDDAIQMVEKAGRGGQPYDVAIIDLKMPHPDGLEVAQTLRALPAAPAVIMISAYGADELCSLLSSGSAPFATCLTKPHTPMQLYEAIRAALGLCPQPASTGASANTPAPALAGMKILIVEDNALNRKVANDLLFAEGAIITLAEGGLEGVATATSDTADFDVIIMDIQMPDLDGLEATRRIRSHPCGRNCPIIAMTANVTQSDREACLAAGMDDHVGKPLDMEELIPVLLRATGQQTSLPQKIRRDPGKDTDELVEPYQSIQIRFRGSLDTYAEVLKIFEGEVVPNLRRARMLLETGRFPELDLCLHSLKGTAATAGAVRMARLLGVLEHQVRHQSSGIASETFLQRLDDLEALLPVSMTALREQAQALLAGPVGTNPVDAGLKGEADPVVWHQELMSLKGKLQLGDASACDVVGMLVSVSPCDLHDFTQRLAGLVERFDFAQALQLIDELEGPDRDAIS